MNVEYFTARMNHTAQAIRHLTQDVPDEQARWRPDSDAWSILEVINHLYDEEREDFRARLEHTLHQHDRPWPGIDPQGWVAERRYNERDLSQSLGNFLREREESLRWLNSLSAPNWQAAYDAPFGTITAGDLFAAWAVHDLLHLRQLVELHYAYIGHIARPYKGDYAGEW